MAGGNRPGLPLSRAVLWNMSQYPCPGPARHLRPFLRGQLSWSQPDQRPSLPQLTPTPPGLGRNMGTVRLSGASCLLPSWLAPCLVWSAAPHTTTFSQHLRPPNSSGLSASCCFQGGQMEGRR